MFAFFDGLVSFLSSVINFIVNFFTGLVNFFVMVGESLVFITECIGYMPPFLIVFITAIVALSIILQIVNHGG
ncbi:MAG: hypothetical protein HFH85_16080 [Lachnospiraceae bacterium]|nr:hypothetical protein [Lachnospiraceae bacterium]